MPGTSRAAAAAQRGPSRPPRRAPEYREGEKAGESFFRDLPEVKGDSHPDEGCEGRCGAPGKGGGGEPPRPRVGESERGQVPHTRVYFPLQVEGEKRGRGSCRGCGAAPRPLPACPTAQGRRGGPDRAEGVPQGWRGPPSPAAPVRPLLRGRRAPAGDGDGAAGAPPPLTCGFTPTARPEVTDVPRSVCPGVGARNPVCPPPPRHVPFPPPLGSPSAREAASGLSCSPQAPGGVPCRGIRAGKGGPDGWPSAQGKSLSPGAAAPAGGAPCAAPSRGERSPGRGAAAARWSREEGKAEARLLVRIVIFHQSPAICVSAPDRTPAVLLAGVTETTQRWRRANCICSPAHRSKLRPSHGAGKGAKGPCDMREI